MRKMQPMEVGESTYMNPDNQPVFFPACQITQYDVPCMAKLQQGLLESTSKFPHMYLYGCAYVFERYSKRKNMSVSMYGCT
jgi:hypothetical protein